MKYVLILILFIYSSISSAEINANGNTFCEWMGSAANSVALNRDKGIDEYELIDRYLKQGSSYGEQSVVIPLIDRVYNKKQTLSPDELAFAERRNCEIATVKFGP